MGRKSLRNSGLGMLISCGIGLIDRYSRSFGAQNDFQTWTKEYPIESLPLAVRDQLPATCEQVIIIVSPVLRPVPGGAFREMTPEELKLSIEAKFAQTFGGEGKTLDIKPQDART